MTEQQLRDTLRRGLSEKMPEETRRAILTKVRERKDPMRLKWNKGWAAALILVLLTATTALAWNLNREYFEDVATLQFESGYYDDWGLEEKRAMVGILAEYGLLTEQEASSLREEPAIDAWMIDRYGINGRSDTIGLWAILDKELGTIDTWSLEQKAWLTEVLIRVGLMTPEKDDDLHDLPQEGDMQPEQAIQTAREAVEAAWELQAGTLNDFRVDLNFCTIAADWERKYLHYEVYFIGEGEQRDYYTCVLTRDGRLVDSTMDLGGWQYLSPAEERAAREAPILPEPEDDGQP